MATRGRYLPGSAEFPTSNFPQYEINAQSRPILRFDAATDESCVWTDLAPQGLTGTLTLLVYYYAVTATTGSVRFEALVEAVTDADALDLDSAESFATTNSAGAAVPGTQGHMDVLSITLTNDDSIAAGDYFRIRLRRDADGTTGTDDAAGDCAVLACELRDGS